MNKKEIRKEQLSKLNSLNSEYINEQSNKIKNLVINSSEYKNANIIFIYLSTKQEVQTREIIEDAWKNNKKVAVPLIREKGIMDAVLIENFNDLEINFYGIEEPKYNVNRLVNNEIDLAIIPCLSANNKRIRLGYGGGYYDRFLKDKDLYKLCICFESQIRDDLPFEEHDIIMDKVIH